MATAAEFFTAASLVQIGGATLAVSVVAVVLGQLVKSDSPWIPFLTALTLTILMAGSAGALPNPIHHAFGSPAFFGDLITWLVVILNACLLFCGAVGINAVGWAARTRGAIPHGEKQSFRKRPRPKLLTPWL